MLHQKGIYIIGNVQSKKLDITVQNNQPVVSTGGRSVNGASVEGAWVWDVSNVAAPGQTLTRNYNQYSYN